MRIACDNIVVDAVAYRLQVTPLRRNLLPNMNALVAVMRAVKYLLQQNPPVLNLGCRIMQVVAYNGRKVVVVVVAVAVAAAAVAAAAVAVTS